MFWWLSSLLLDNVSSFAVAYIFDVVVDVGIIAVVSVDTYIIIAAVVVIVLVVYVLMAL